jgi:hypothetical protein
MRFKSVLVVPAVVLSLVGLSACTATEDKSESVSAPPVQVENVAAAKVTDYRAIPAIPANPAASGKAAGLDFGTLTKVTIKDGNILLHVDRSMFYMGADVKQHPGNFAQDVGYSIEDTDGEGKEFIFPLDPTAPIQAQYSLKNDFNAIDRPSTQELTVDQFVSNAERAQADGEQVFVWLRHSNGPEGPVTAVTEQATP